MSEVVKTFGPYKDERYREIHIPLGVYGIKAGQALDVLADNSVVIYDVEVEEVEEQQEEETLPASDPPVPDTPPQPPLATNPETDLTPEEVFAQAQANPDE